MVAGARRPKSSQTSVSSPVARAETAGAASRTSFSRERDGGFCEKTAKRRKRSGEDEAVRVGGVGMGPPRDPPTESTLAQISLARRERETLERERRWFVRKRPRRDINLGSETEVTVTSKRHAQAERAKRDMQSPSSVRVLRFMSSTGTRRRAKPRARAAARQNRDKWRHLSYCQSERRVFLFRCSSLKGEHTDRARKDCSTCRSGTR